MRSNSFIERTAKGTAPFVVRSRRDLATAEKRTPPEPDILCTHRTEGSVAFELVEICDPNLARFNATVTDGMGGAEGAAKPTCHTGNH